MASITTSRNGTRRILFVDAHGDRKAIHLGKLPKRQAEEVRLKIEALASAQRSGVPLDGETASWLGRIGDELADKLANVGLIPRREPTQAVRLVDFLDQYVQMRTDLKPSTAEHFRHLRRFLVSCFGDRFTVAEMTEADVEKFRIHLSQSLALNTARRHLGRMRQLFRYAVRAKLVAQNPLDYVRGVTVRSNRDRCEFIPQATVDKLLESIGCPQLRLIVGLARYAGLRVPSEPLQLTWGNVNLETRRMIVYAVKKEHLGQATRVVPILPKLEPLLLDVFEGAEPGETFVITRFRERGASVNLRTAVVRALDRAGIPRWQKLFVNLRSSFATELAREHPRHVATAILGHSEAIAQEHYWQVDDADLDAVIEGTRQATRNPTQYTTVYTSTESQADLPANEKTPDFPGVAVGCGIVHKCQSTRPGFEPGMREPKSLVLPVTPPGKKSRDAAAHLASVPSGSILESCEVLASNPAHLHTLVTEIEQIGSPLLAVGEV